MRKLPWVNLLLLLLVFAILLQTTACSLNLKGTVSAFTQLPHRLGQGVVNLLGGLRGVGSALGEQFHSIFGGMTGRHR